MNRTAQKKSYLWLAGILLIPVLIAIFTHHGNSQKSRGSTENISAAISAEKAAEQTVVPIEHTKKVRYTIKTNALGVLPPHEHEAFVDSLTDQGHGVIISSPTITIPEDMWVTRVHTKINNAPYTSLHHAVLWRLDQNNPLCQSFFRILYASANDTTQTPVDFPAPYAMFLKKGTPVLFQAMLHNAYPPMGPGGLYTDVSVELELDVLPPDAGHNPKPLELFYLTLRDHYCDPTTENIFTVPPNVETYIKASDPTNPKDTAHYTFPVPGTVLGLGSHIHPWEGGISTDVLINNALVTTLTAQKSSDESWSWFSPRLYTFTHVKKGDTLSIQTTYTNPTNEPVRGAMGIVIIYFSPNDPGATLMHNNVPYVNNPYRGTP